MTTTIIILLSATVLLLVIEHELFINDKFMGNYMIIRYNIYQFIYLFIFKNKTIMKQKKFHFESRETGILATGQSDDRHRDDVHRGDYRRMGLA